MRIYVPLGFILVFISLYFFYESNRLRKAKHEERKLDRQQRFQETLDKITKKTKQAPPGNEDSN